MYEVFVHWSFVFNGKKMKTIYIYPSKGFGETVKQSYSEIKIKQLK